MRILTSFDAASELTHLCDAFGMTLAQFFMDGEETELVSAQEKNLLEQYRKLSEEKRKAVLTLLED